MKISLRFKKLVSFILTFSIILSLLPSFALIANAAKQTSILDEKIIIDYSQDIKISGDKVTLSVKASSLFGTASKTNTFYFINNTDDMIELSFDYTASNCTGFSWGVSGKQSFVLDKGEETDAFTITAKASSFSSVTAELILSNVSLRILRDSVVTFKYNESMGVVTSNGSIISNDSIVNVDSKGLPVKVAANEGYHFFGWKIISEENSGKIFSYDSDTTLSFNDDVTVEAVFVSSTTALFGVGSERFYNLNDACVFASSGSTKTVVLLNNGTVSGAHTIPSGVTLLIPFNAANTVYTSSPECTSSFLNNKAWEQPYAYRTLTLAGDANITVNGKEPMSLSEFNSMKNSGTLVTVTINNKDITKQSNITTKCSATSCIINVKYNNKEQQKVVKIKEDIKPEE